MNTTSTCFECGELMTVTNEDRPYEGDLNVTIKGLEVRRCAACGEEEEVFPGLDGLHKAIAHALIRKPGRFTSAEIRFLRTFLGHSSTDFAELMGVSLETVSRWERSDGRYRMATTADRYLRTLVVLGRRVRQYRLQLTGDASRADDMLVFSESGCQWEPAAAFA